MKTYIVDEKEVKVPTDWSEITLGKYIELAKLETLRDQFDIPELYSIRILEEITEANLDEMIIGDLQSAVNDLQFLYTQPKWLKHDSIKIGDVQYGFKSEITKLTNGEYISIKTLQTDKGADAVPYILSVICRPIVDGKMEKYDPSKTEERVSIFKQQPIEYFMGNINFFLSESLK